MYCDKRNNFNMKFVFLWRIIKTLGDDILRGWNRGEAAKVRVFPIRKNCLFFLTGLKMVVGVGFCKIKVDSNLLLVLKIKCTKFHQDQSKTVDLHTKYTNKQTFSFIYIDCWMQKCLVSTVIKILTLKAVNILSLETLQILGVEMSTGEKRNN
jgi:hypothetical protein